MTLLVDMTLNFKHIVHKNAASFCQKNAKSFCSAKASHNFSAKNITVIDFERTARLDESVTNTFVKLTML